MLQCFIVFMSGTICAVDPAQKACFNTGDSGSGLMMERFQGGYSWEGTLSTYRGCTSEYATGVDDVGAIVSLINITLVIMINITLGIMINIFRVL